MDTKAFCYVVHRVKFSVDGVAFRVAGTPLAGALDGAGDGSRFDLLGRLNRNNFNGREKVQFILTDLRQSNV